MKKILNLLILLSVVMGIYSCQKDFLQKPDTTGTSTLETVFSSKVTAEAAIANAYRDILIHGLPGGSALSHGTVGAISGEVAKGYGWHSTLKISENGLSTTDGGRMTDNYAQNYAVIRKAYLILENIDKVADMDASLKGYVKAEMKGLIAYRYMGMFIRYGGVPIVTKSLTTDDDLAIKRATLKETLDFITKLCDESIAGLPANWEDKFYGRLTKGAVMAIKAKAFIYAARPLFNSSAPYLSLGGTNDNLISFGSVSAQRWTDAITANEAVLTWASANSYALINTGGAGVGNPNPKAFEDYGTATSISSNREVLLAYKVDQFTQIFKFTNYTPYQSTENYDTDQSGGLTNALEKYYKKDGSNETWPAATAGNPLNANARPYSEYQAKIANLEPRFQADNRGIGFDSPNNPGDNNWSANGNRAPSLGTATAAGYGGSGSMMPTKYFYKAGGRNFIEYPIFRLAETYLNLAEAYNEAGQTVKALENLNKVHNRAGLPVITITNQSDLRAAIQREWAIEYYFENHRYYDAKHWKLSNIDNGVIGGPMRILQFTSNGGNSKLPANLLTYFDAVVYNSFWHPRQYLEPFPQDEINKLIIIQNPGY